jgi:hypothetical protein
MPAGQQEGTSMSHGSTTRTCRRPDRRGRQVVQLDILADPERLGKLDLSDFGAVTEA